MFTVYVLFSKVLNKFYVGYTGDDIIERIKKHNSKHKGFTGVTNDWELKYFEKFESKNDALRREKEIKSWKSKPKIQLLISN